jgi:hypothetical protein
MAVIASFTASYPVTVTLAGAGSGSVVSNPLGIVCGTNCQKTWDLGTSVVLTATPDANSIFAGWSGGGCSGTGTCTINVSAVTAVTATFAPATYVVTVALAGNGTGAVSSTPAGISCGADCTEPFATGSSVVLSAAPAVGSTFSGWSGGGCSGTGTCSVTVSAATTVTATFTLNTFTLTISKSDPATITSAPAGITCGATCAAVFNYGTVVTLTSNPVGSVLTGWSGGGCSGTGNCTLTITANVTVSAVYRQLRVALESSVSSCLRNVGNVLPRLQTLLMGRGHSVTIVAGVGIDTALEIAAYDVIVIPGPGANGCVQQDMSSYDPVVDAYVRTGGGGVVGSGWLLYSSFGVPGITGVLPSTVAANFLSGNQAITVTPGSPITTGVGSFTANQYVPWGSGPRAGATPLLTVGATTVAESWTVGNGRAVFSGPMFFEDYVAYDNESLLDGTQPSAIEFFLRSIEWSGKAR